jgi:hypothetical protein
LSVMLKFVTRVLLAFIVAIAVAMPVSVRVVPMAMSADNMAGMAGNQPCHECARLQKQGGTAPDKMPSCATPVCITAPAVLPVPALLPVRISVRADHIWPPDARLVGADRAPDPFPPRPIVLD